MPTEKQMTGYPSIDKPWLKYYTEEAINTKMPECTMFEYLYNNNKEHLNETAIVYFGNKITYKKLFENIDRAAASFNNLGVKAGDVVSIIAITTPEIIYSFYALNKLGAVANMIDPRMSDETIINLIKRTNSNIVITLDVFAEKFEMLCKINEMNNLINIRISNSMPLLYKIVSATKKTINIRHEKIIQWTDLMSKKSYKNIIGSYESLALLEYTGGTTGEPKAVSLTNFNVNAVVEQYRRTGIDFARGRIWQSVSAPFIAYVWVISMHCPLSFGIKCQIELYDPKTIAESIIKKKYNHVAANPFVWESLIRHPKAQKTNFKRLIVPTTGADYMSPKLEMEINEFLTKHGCEYKICQGYGMTEVGSAVCVNISNTINKLGSVGIPFSKTLISAFEVDGDRELRYGESGEICICGPSVMKGYWGNSQATADMIKKHSDGKIWLHTGDLGHIDQDGFVYIDGRLKRMIIKHNGAKVFPPIIEKTILEHNSVGKCAVVGVADKNNSIGSEPIAFIVKNSNTENSILIEELKVKCKEKIPEYAQPIDFVVIDKMPLTPIGKVDYRALEKEAEKL